MTEQQAKELGFEYVKEYPHDRFLTRRYKQRYILLEFTYKNNEIHTIDCSIDEVVCLPVEHEDLKDLVRILDKAI